MIKEINRKKDDKNSTKEIKVNDESIESLKEKLNKINNPTESSQINSTNSPDAKSTTIQENKPQNVAGAPEQNQVRMADAEFVADNERIINLIMQQIKELIEIDNNLNMKLKEIENKSTSLIRDINHNKKTVGTFNDRLQYIEKNMEKFMGLYELVTNKYNPFVNDKENNFKVDESKVSKEPTEKKNKIKPLPIEDNINEGVSHAKKEIKSEPVMKANLLNNNDTKSKNTKSINDALNDKISVQNKFKAIKERMAREAKQNANPIRENINTEQIPAENASDSVSSTVNIITEEVEIENKLEDLKNKQATIESIEKNIIEKQISNQVPQIADSISESTSIANSHLHKKIPSSYHLETEDGRTIQTLNDFVGLIQEMNDNELQEHIISQKHNYAQWLDLALKDPELTAKFNSSENSKIGIISSLINK